MVVLMSKFARVSANPPSKALPSFSQVFASHAHDRLLSLLSDAEPASLSTGKLSLSWLRRCLDMLPYMNRAFARLVASVDHPMSAWGSGLADEYLSYTLNLLEHLNRMSSAVNRLGHARVSLAHVLSVSGSVPPGSVKRLNGVMVDAPGKDYGKVRRRGEDGRGRTGAGKDWAICKALDVMKGVEFWVSGVVISALSSCASPYLEMRPAALQFLGPSVAAYLDKKLHEGILEKGICLAEVMEINDSVDAMASNGDGKSRGDEAQVLRSRLDGIEKMMEGLRKEVDCLFSEVLDSRNALLDCMRAAHC
ncbi:hypothetical protein MLD38_002775 [Melastoma candidum]|uniref:Uncharacterized protein n=1 Tax=Melastoma candidum TaxID=119954 RepID=A0ACB9S206_9MYRT|nr:hypothetical protein MLD38_002775 [Melastoma candidum]